MDKSVESEPEYPYPAGTLLAELDDLAAKGARGADLLATLPDEVIARVASALTGVRPPPEADPRSHEYYADCQAVSIVLRAELFNRPRH